MRSEIALALSSSATFSAPNRKSRFAWSLRGRRDALDGRSISGGLAQKPIPAPAAPAAGGQNRRFAIA